MMSLNRTKRHARRVYFYPKSRQILLVLLVALVYTNLVRISPLPATTSLPAQATALSTTASKNATKPEVLTATTTVSTYPATSGGNQQASQTTPVVRTSQACTGSPYALPASLPVTSLPSGLNKVVDTPTHYQVYGSSIPELRTAIENCPLRRANGAYHASTSYQLNWSYAVSVSGTTCRLTNVKIGLHVSQYMPAFVPTSSTPAGTKNAWNRYIANLQTHENGHVAIDTDYAQRLTNTLQNMGSVDCANPKNQVQTIINSYVTMLNAANELYDSQTGHGATQGAVL
ncbi:DUF922 domain-containing protein [Candidatus Saccharibacteria bacterium]|nr:DUF922 domain-containing protein [Candidatus Saccharibacteria bacterium]